MRRANLGLAPAASLPWRLARSLLPARAPG